MLHAIGVEPDLSQPGTFIAQQIKMAPASSPALVSAPET
jgi:hypothetical protein